MASIKLKFRTSSVQEKEGRLYYQVIHNRVARQIHTEYRIYSSEWDADHSNIILPTSVTPQRQAYLLSLKDTLDADRKKLLLVIARLDKEGQSYTADTVVDNFHEGKELHGIIGYTLELNEKLRRIGKKRMVARYKTTLNSLQRYLKGGDVPLEEVDGTTIQGYEQWLKDSGLCRNTTSFYIRNLRTIYNHAVDDGLVISSSPFKHVYTGIDKTVKPVVFFSFVLLLAVNVSTGHDELLKEIGAEALPLAYAFCAIIMLYLVGIADDLIGVRYRAKFFIQIVCGIMLVAGGVELSDLHGMLFIHSMPSWISIPLTVFVTVFIINAINLIDGIDGLASGLCSIAFLFYGMTFIWFHQYLYAMLAFATLGVLIPFYYYKEIYIETERIIIRNFKQKDAEGLLEYLSHPRVNCFAGDRLCSREAAWAYMQYSPKDMLRYAVSLKKDDFIIGDVFALRENEDTYNVGWHFNKRFEGKGFACEAAAGLLDYLFREAGARRIYGFVEDDNIRSKRLCERLGMRREGCFKEFVTFVNNPDGSPKYEDTCVYAILEKEWNTIRQW